MTKYNQTIYQIYPLGFCGAPKENDGILEHRITKVIDWIPHIKKLGISMVMFNPLFESDRHGYDTRDFTKIDCRLGTNEDFKKVCSTLQENGIQVMLDGVFNHVGRGCPMFLDVIEKKWESPYSDWFYINYNDTWAQDGFTYQNWEGHNELVKLNLDNPTVRNYLFNAIDQWVNEFHIAGLRLDVAYCLNPVFLDELRHHINQNHPDLLLVGEMIGGDYNVLFNNNRLDAVTNYECRKGLFSSMNTHNLFEIGYSLNRQFGKDPWCLYTGKHLLSFVDNHDVDRIASTLEDQRDLPLTYALMNAMPGIPAYYYGSEWGTQAKRTPYSDDDLRPNFDHPEWNMLCDIVQKLNEIRLQYPVFTNGDYQQIYLQNQQIVFRRRDEEGQLTFYLNIADQPVDISCNTEVEKGIDLFTNEEILLNAPIHLDSKSFKFLYTKW